ncbi:ion transporter [Actinotalea sp. BY-33]|uniref:Ion transporter n=1 Tax=Actinotalea soli TaxID=2819234 RepID=A0A939LT96_9CELL|nr:ion transporter [Actinotalea soli]MBO1752295.1 ion transporter [Actinotalea soli]
MTNDDLAVLEGRGLPRWRLALAGHVESSRVQRFVVAVILVNAVLLGLETDARVMASVGGAVRLLDTLCLAVFVVELVLKMLAYGTSFWRSGWRVFDFVVVGIALVPGAGPWAVLRSLRVLRVLRLLTVVPSLRKVVAAFLHAIPGLLGVTAVMAIFFYTASVLATQLFGETFPQWFGGIGASLYSLFQIMTLESWSMGIVRPVMEVHPYAWAFFVPFIMIATFTILNLFIGIIVSTMQELATGPEPVPEHGPGTETAAATVSPAAPAVPATLPALPRPAATQDDAAAETLALITRLEDDLRLLRARVEPTAAPATGPTVRTDHAAPGNDEAPAPGVNR